MRSWWLALITCCALSAHAEIRQDPVEYRDGDAVLEGFLVRDDAATNRNPGILVFHEWSGPRDYELKRGRILARMGYVAFVADVFGKDVRPETFEACREQATMYRNDRSLMRSRAQEALRVLRSHPAVDPDRIAAIGYCFGGTVALELARSGADISGVVSFHGGLDTPDPNDAQRIRTKILALCGADDPFVPAEQVAAFEDEMRKAGVDWQLVSYGGAVHRFSNPGAGSDKSSGAAYDESADRRSWSAMKQFFAEIFR